MSAEQRQLIDAAGKLGVALEASAAARLLQLLDELTHWGRAYNLSAISAREAMIHQHLLDSLSAHLDLAGNRIADVGTGAGFPGLPLALVNPARHFTLIDSNGKKIRFVAHAMRTLGLGNVTPLHARAETLAVSEPFDTVIARAVTSLPDLLAQVTPLCGPDSRVLALKGRYPQDEISKLPRGWRLARARAVQIPGLDAARHILTLVRQPVFSAPHDAATPPAAS